MALSLGVNSVNSSRIDSLIDVMRFHEILRIVSADGAFPAFPGSGVLSSFLTSVPISLVYPVPPANFIRAGEPLSTGLAPHS